MSYVIEKGVPMPENAKQMGEFGKTLIEMEVGDSFFVPGDEKIRNNLSAKLSNFRAYHPEFKDRKFPIVKATKKGIADGQEVAGYRVFRGEDKTKKV